MTVELDHALAYLRTSGVPHVVTSTTNHKPLTSAGFPSYHRKPGTPSASGDIGLAFDSRGPNRSSRELLAIFLTFSPVHSQLHELILSHPGLDYNIKDGRAVEPYATGDHKDHVHLSVEKGTFLPLPQGVPMGQELHVFVRGTQGGLWQRWIDSNGGVHGWAQIGQSDDDQAALYIVLKPDSHPMPVVVDGKINVFVRGTDDGLYRTWYDNGWQNPEAWGGVLTSSPGVVAR